MSKKRPQEGDLVIVDWDDSASTGSWISKKDIDSDNEGMCRCRSVGWITKLTPKAMTLHSSESPNQVADLMCVPRSCIVKMERLRATAASRRKRKKKR